MSHVISMGTPVELPHVEQQSKTRRILAWRIALTLPLVICLLMCGFMGAGQALWQTASGILLLMFDGAC